MKNFYEITAIDTRHRLRVKIELVEHHGAKYCFAVNNLPARAVMTFDLLDELRFSCQIQSGAVEVAKIAINGHEVLPIYQHLASPATNWITTDWEFVVSAPFYPWYHRVTGQGWTA